MDEISELKVEIAKLKALTAKKEEILFRAENKLISIDNEAIASLIRATKHSLICPFCGITVGNPPTISAAHMGCYTTGRWSKGFRTHNDWVRACIENGASINRIFNEEK